MKIRLVRMWLTAQRSMQGHLAESVVSMSTFLDLNATGGTVSASMMECLVSSCPCTRYTVVTLLSAITFPVVATCITHLAKCCQLFHAVIGNEFQSVFPQEMDWVPEVSANTTMPPEVQKRYREGHIPVSCQGLVSTVWQQTPSPETVHSTLILTWQCKIAI